MISMSYCQQCLCGWSFSDTGAFTRHKKSCLRGKKRLANALSHAKESYHSKKCCIEDESSAGSSSQIIISDTIPHHDSIDDTLGGAALEVSTIPSSMDTVELSQTKVLNEAHISRVYPVCICSFVQFYLMQHIRVVRHCTS